MTQKRRDPAVVCAEHVAFNYLLHEVPKPPQQKRTSQLDSSNKTYTLPFSKERDLVEILSFLAKTEDGSDYIPAICVEQDLAGASLKVLLAINKSTWSDGDDILRALKEGLEKIFSVLHESQYENGSSSVIKKEILNSILGMCSTRILCRLRLAPSNRKGPRPSIKDILQKAIEGIHCINPDKILHSNLMDISSSFLTESKKVIQLVNNWSKYRVQSRLGDLVEGVCRLDKLQDLSDLLRLIPSGVAQHPNFASSLLNIISKVSRYEEAATVLYRIAKKFTLVRNMEPQLATLPREVYNRLHNPRYSPSLSNMVSMLGLINGRRYNLCQISRIMKPDKDKTPSKRFLDQTKKTLKEAKVHAEIQLIAYCEIISPELFPRAIGSSKDACFLCNAFIEKHGKMHTSRTHGRLYPGWRLPKILQFKALEQQFNQVLLNQVRQTIGARVNGRTLIYPQPNESTLLPLSVSGTTVSTVRHKVVNPTPESAAFVPLHFPHLESVEAAASVAKNTLGLRSPRASTRASSSDSVVTSYTLAPGESFSGRLGSKRTSPFFVAGSLEVQIEMETESTSELAAIPLAYSIERIAKDNPNDVRGKSLVVDPLGLERETFYELPEDNSFCIAVQDVTLRVISYPSGVD